MSDEKVKQERSTRLIVTREDFLKDPAKAIRLADTAPSVGIRDPDGVVRSFIVAQRDPLD